MEACSFEEHARDTKKVRPPVPNRDRAHCLGKGQADCPGRPPPGYPPRWKLGNSGNRPPTATKRRRARTGPKSGPLSETSGQTHGPPRTLAHRPLRVKQRTATKKTVAASMHRPRPRSPPQTARQEPDQTKPGRTKPGRRTSTPFCYAVTSPPRVPPKWRGDFKHIPTQPPIRNTKTRFGNHRSIKIGASQTLSLKVSLRLFVGSRLVRGSLVRG